MACAGVKLTKSATVLAIFAFLATVSAATMTTTGATTVQLLALASIISPLVSATTMTRTTATSTTTASAGCGGVVRCLDHPQCAMCLDAINNTAMFPHTQVDYFNLDLAAQRAYQTAFFEVLQTTASCSSTALDDVLYPALQELETT
jgi:hypothetical protein